MWDVIFIGLFVLLAFILTADSLNKFRTSRKWLFAVAAAIGGLAMLVSLLDLTSGLFLSALTIIVRIIASRMKQP